MQKTTYRDYQKTCIKHGLDILNNIRACKEVVVSCTASGKSYVIVGIAKKLNKPLLVIQPTRELLIQNYSKFVKAGGKASICCSSLKVKTINKEPYTLFEGDYIKCKEVSNITFATPNSIPSILKEFIKLGVVHAVIDECHIYTKGGSKLRATLAKMKVNNILGLTASPIFLESTEEGSILKMINRANWGLFTDIRHVVQISEVIEKGHWSKIIYSNYTKLDKTLLSPNKSGSEFNKESVEKFYKKNNLHEIVLKYLEKLKQDGRKSTLIFCTNIEQANELSYFIKGSKVISSETDDEERDEIVKDFKEGRLRVLINIGIFTTGFDYPLLSSIINCRPTMSVGLYYQIIGRGVRTHPDKKDFRYIDLAGNIDRFGKVEGFTFEKIPLYNWGMFNEKNELLTDFPIKIANRPTKQSLYNSCKREMDNTPVDYSMKIGFGKNKKLSVQEVFNTNKGYLMWLMGEQSFDWSKRLALKKQIEMILGIK